MIPNGLLPIANRRWQSTLFAGIAGFLTLLLRNNRAHARYCLSCHARRNRGLVLFRPWWRCRRLAAVLAVLMVDAQPGVRIPAVGGRSSGTRPYRADRRSALDLTA